MRKIDVAGLQHKQTKRTIETAVPDRFEVSTHDDMEAAMGVEFGQLDYYIGACNTDAGTMLSIATAVTGYNRSCTIAKLGIKTEDEHITEMIVEGEVAFSLSIEHVGRTIPMLVSHLK